MEALQLYYEALLQVGSEEAIDLVIGIKGFTTETLDEITYYYTGYRDFEGLQLYLNE